MKLLRSMATLLSLLTNESKVAIESFRKEEKAKMIGENIQRRLFGGWSLAPCLFDWRMFDQEGVHRSVAQLLFHRGIEAPTDMQSFLHARYEDLGDPFRLVDMSKAAQRILRGITQGEHITVYGDYDADGVTSASLLYLALKRLVSPSCLIDVYLPHRFKEERGLHCRAVDALSRRGTTLIITTDCGSSDSEAIAYAQTMGIDVIVTDHHHVPHPSPLPHAFLNPWRPEYEEDRHGNRSLGGVGVAFNLVQALYRWTGRSVREEQELLGLVAIGTIADMVPLRGDNHLLVRFGLQQLQHTTAPGLRALMNIARVQPGEPVQERTIAFRIAPLINAAGRMKEAALAFSLLTTEEREDAVRLAQELDHLNQERREHTNLMLTQARTQAQSQRSCPVLLLSGDNWHQGVLGLVANTLAQEYRRPVVVVSFHQSSWCSGSLRSPSGFNCIEALHRFAGPFQRCGGHVQAAGFTIERAWLADLHLHLIREWEQQARTQRQRSSSRQKIIDREITSAHMLTASFYAQIRSLAPFGCQFEEPVFLLRRVRCQRVSRTFWGTQMLWLTSLDGAWRTVGYWAREDDGIMIQPGSVITIIFALDAPRKSEQNPRLRLFFAEKFLV